MNRTYFPESYHIFQEQECVDELLYKNQEHRNSLLNSIQMSNLDTEEDSISKME